mgnify:CR=1 FL=1
MNITNIKIRRTYEDNRLRALVSLTLEGDFAVHDIKVIEGSERLFVAMPSRRDEQGSFQGRRWKTKFSPPIGNIWRKRPAADLKGRNAGTI